MTFRTVLGETIFNEKYRNDAGGCDTWSNLVDVLVERVCKGKMSPGDITQLAYYIREKKFIPAGRYLYYAGRPASFFNNCFAMIAEDSREGWADLASNHMMALMCGGGVGTYYGNIREKGSLVKFTGGTASGPVPLMYTMNEIGRNVMQGGTRRSALYASLPWNHPDIKEFMIAKDWSDAIKKKKETDFNFAAPFDMTNMSVVYNNAEGLNSTVFKDNIRRAAMSGEPGFQFDFGKIKEIGRNACTEFITDSDSDMCNLGSVNLSQIKNITEMKDVCELASQFLYCGSLVSTLPYKKCYNVRTEKRKIGLGLMGVHEWLLANGHDYSPEPLAPYLAEYRWHSVKGADHMANKLSTSECIRYRAVAPAGTIALLAGTTSGIEPLFATSLKRRWYDQGSWKYQYIIEPTAQMLVDKFGTDPQDMETSFDLSKNIKKRIHMQVYIQRHVDMGISSTINLPAWGTEFNNEDTLQGFEDLVRDSADQIRGITFYPDGSRGGQPLTACDWDEAVAKQGATFKENQKVIENEMSGCSSGMCGI